MAAEIGTGGGQGTWDELSKTTVCEIPAVTVGSARLVADRSQVRNSRLPVVLSCGLICTHASGRSAAA